MKSNKVFLGLSAVLAVIVFTGLAFWLRPATEPTPTTPAVSSEKLVRFHSPTKGAENAKVTVVEFLDPECEACRAMHPIVKRLLAEYEGKVRLVIRYLPFHGNSMHAAAALEEAREVGKFDEALDKLFETQPSWGDHHHPKPELIAVYLKEIGIDEKRLDKDYLIEKHKAKINVDAADGQEVGANRTPTFFVNGKILNEIGYEPLKAAIERALSEN